MALSNGPEVIQQLRRMTAETDTESSVYSDEEMDVAITAADGNLRAAAAQIWDEKAAALAALVDTSESGSSRRMSQAHTNALAMATGYRTDATASVAGASGTRNRRIVRP